MVYKTITIDINKIIEYDKVEEEHELVEKVFPYLTEQMQKGLKLILFKKNQKIQQLEQDNSVYVNKNQYHEVKNKKSIEDIAQLKQ